MRKTDRRFATAADTLDVEALLDGVDGYSRRPSRRTPPAASNDVFRVQGGRVMPLPMAA